MRAIANTRYGSPDGLRLAEVERPALGPDQVLVRVRASSVNPLDWHVMRGEPYVVRLMEGLRAPKQPIRGVDVAGVVEAAGENVPDLQPGDEVFGSRGGAFAEYVSGKTFVRKPANMTFEQAATVPAAGCTALQALRDKGTLQAGQRVLINGAAGGVGTFAVQIAKAFGADVTGVCSTTNVEVVASIGADRAIDYTVADFTRDGQRYDLIVDNVGNHSLMHLRRALTPKGTLVGVGGEVGNWIGAFTGPLKALVVSRFVGQRFVSLLAKVTKDDLLVLAELMEAGKVTPVIDRTYPLSETAEAIRYLETGRARGKVVITI